MSRKKVCFTCKKAFNLPTDATTSFSLACPECQGQTILFDHKFRPPKKNDLKGWKVAEFLSDHGFSFQHIHKNAASSPKDYAQYPDTIEEATIFVIKYKSQSACH